MNAEQVLIWSVATMFACLAIAAVLVTAKLIIVSYRDWRGRE